MAEQHITQEMPANSIEKMSFGPHRDKTNAEVWSQHKSYVQWAIQTMQESDDVNWRLRRFVTWAMSYKGPPTMPTPPQAGYQGWEPIPRPPFSRRLIRCIVQHGRERSPSRARAAPTGARSHQEGEDGTGTCRGPSQEPPRDLSLSDAEDAEALSAYPEQQCHEHHKHIGRNWKEENNPFSKAWSELIQSQRLFLLEVACSERSVLTQEACRCFSEHSAQRFSIWNGYDLTTAEGV